MSHFTRYTNRNARGEGAGGAGAGGAGAGGAADENAARTPYLRRGPRGDSFVYIMGHGGIYNDQYTVIPDKLSMAFFEDRSRILYTDKINQILLSRSEGNRPIEQDHILFEKAAMKNMYVDLRGFYLYMHTRELACIGYSGIITDQTFPTLFFNLRNGDFKKYGIDVITKMPVKVIPNGINEKLKIVSPQLYQQGVTQLKIIHFGDNIYGVIYNNSYYINIINNMSDIIIKNYLVEHHGISYRNLIFKHGLNTTPYGNDSPTSKAVERMHKLSLHFHNDNIIKKKDVYLNHDKYHLGIIFDKIVHSRVYTEPNDIVCYNLICRSDYTPLPEAVNERNEEALTASTTLTTLQRVPSASNQYVRAFENIFERYRNASLIIEGAIDRNQETKNKVKQIYKRIINFYNRNKYIEEEDMEFILELIAMIDSRNNRKLRTLEVYKSAPINRNNSNVYMEGIREREAEFIRASEILQLHNFTPVINKNGIQMMNLIRKSNRILNKILKREALTFMEMNDFYEIIRFVHQYGPRE